MSRCIIVLGIPRSGTSCVAGVLHKLGVNMGQGHFQPIDRFNQRGYFEDLRWRLTNQKITGKGYSTRGLDIESVNSTMRKQWRQIAKECERQVIWGVKDPFFCFVGQFIWPMLQEPRIVAVHRNFDASVKSVARHIQSSYRGRYKGGASRIQTRWLTGFERRILEFGGPIYHINYDELVASPKGQIHKLADWCFEGLSIQPKGSIKKIAQWVTPTLKHF
ncbi:MAG: hypothetical protein GWN93_17270 [Deltaproteobacteria bacterium]|nr:hypothetical protein [Deltaproteobacteria bacterium]